MVARRLPLGCLCSLWRPLFSFMVAVFLSCEVPGCGAAHPARDEAQVLVYCVTLDSPAICSVPPPFVPKTRNAAPELGV